MSKEWVLSNTARKGSHWVQSSDGSIL
jgi:hypothetical protein